MNLMKKKNKCEDCHHHYVVYGCEDNCALENNGNRCKFLAEKDYIKPCPFCGRENMKAVLDHYPIFGKTGLCYTIKCGKCGTTMCFVNKATLIKHWNTRAKQ